LRVYSSRAAKIYKASKNFTALSQINRDACWYNDMIKLYHEEVQKLELLNARLEVTLPKEEYTRRLEGTGRSPKEEFEEVRVKLTEADGGASKRLRNEADYILIWNDKRVAMDAHKA